MSKRNGGEDEGPSRKSRVRKIQKQVADEDMLEQLRQEANAAEVLIENNYTVAKTTDASFTVFLVSNAIHCVKMISIYSLHYLL
jgi:hypothetical protein